MLGLGGHIGFVVLLEIFPIRTNRVLFILSKSNFDRLTVEVKLSTEYPESHCRCSAVIGGSLDSLRAVVLISVKFL